MTESDIRTLRMIASNCVLEKVQRDMLSAIADKEEKYVWHKIENEHPEFPDHKEKVLVFYRKRNTCGKLQYGTDRIIGDYPAGWEGFQKGNRVKAWKNIEPYEEEN